MAMSGTGFKSMALGVIVTLLASSSSFAQDVEDKGRTDLLGSMTANVARRLEEQSQQSVFGPSAPQRSVVPTWQPTSQSARSQNGNISRKIAYGVALGFAGLYGGAFVGSRFGRDCRCDDPGLMGGLIGMPIGAVAGAIFGVWLAGR
jgi:hypothetical protein